MLKRKKFKCQYCWDRGYIDDFECPYCNDPDKIKDKDHQELTPEEGMMMLFREVIEIYSNNYEDGYYKLKREDILAIIQEGYNLGSFMLSQKIIKLGVENNEK